MSTQPSSSKPADRLGRIGVWSGELRFGDASQRADAVAELEELGYGAIWFPGGVGGDVFGDLNALLAGTKTATIATGILNIWRHEPAEAGAWWRAQSEANRARTLLGLGVSHGPIIGADYGRPVATMAAYLDKLDTEGVPVERRCIAALGPKMLDLARDRSAGSHPYLTTPDHTATARERLGPDALLAPELGVILETDAAKARETARQALKLYMGLPNYVNNWRRSGFGDDDVTQPSDRLIDALFGWGDLSQIAAKVKDHLDAGANHVCLQVIRGAVRGDPSLPREAWRALAGVLL